MSSYLNLILNKKILTTLKVGDDIDDVGEQTERMISNLHHLVELEEGRHEIIDLSSSDDLRTLPDWITPLRIVTTAKAPRGRKLKEKGRLVPDRWIAIRDHHMLISRFAQPLAEALGNALMQGRDICNDYHIDEMIAASFEGLRKHCGLPANEVAKAFFLPDPYAWRCEDNHVRLVRRSDGHLLDAPGASHAVTLH